MMASTPVHLFPQQVDRAVEALRSLQGMAVIAIETPATTIRDGAREQVRIALRHTLGVFLNRSAESIILLSAPGKPLRVNIADGRIGLSVSHDAGLSIAALRVNGDVGVDVMKRAAGAGIGLEPSSLPSSDLTAGLIPDWQIVARNYLGDAAFDRIASATPAHRSFVFAQEWTRHEAALKCCGVQMTEWNPDLAQMLAACEVDDLALPNDYCGAMATIR